MRRAVLLLALAGCGENIVDPKLPEASSRFDPPQSYTRWWNMVQSCSGAVGDLSAVSWYRTALPLIPLDGSSVTAYWSQATNRVVVTDQFLLDGAVIRHEMLHSLIRRAGHPREYFVEKCGGVVHCEDACIEPGSEPSGALPLVEATELDLQVSVEPGAPGIGLENGLFSVIVTATNPASHAVRVVVRPRPPGGDLITFTLSMMGAHRVPGRFVRARDPSQSVFMAGEMKRHVFDFRTDPTGAAGVLPGSYRIIAGYVAASATPVEVLVRAE
jgi:hypothetical protein